MTSLWLDRGRRGATADLQADPLPSNRRFDDLVVGAGLTGLTTALLLARAGRQVGVLDAGEPGGLTTGHTTAKVSLLQGTKLSRLSGGHSPRTMRAYVDANLEGQQWLARFCADHDVPVQRRDAITYAPTAKDVATVRREHQHALEHDLPVSWTDELDVPFPLHSATVLPDQLQLDPMDVVEALVQQLRAHGGTVHPHQRVVGVDRDGDGSGAVVRLEAGKPLRAENVVLATGMPILDRTLAFAQLEPARSYLLAFRGVQPPPGMYLSAGQPTRSLREVPTDDGPVLLVGGNGHVVGRTSSEQRAVDDLRSWTREFFPGAEETHAWSAQDYSAPGGGLPQVGVAPLSGGRVHYASGFDKWGMTNGVAAALAMAAAILGDRPGWARELEPPDLSPRALAGMLGLNAKVGAHMLGGHARQLAQSVVGGRTCRLRAICTHLGGPLHWNDAEGTWDCKLHGSRFDASGEVIEGPAVRPLARLDDAGPEQAP